MTDWSDICEEQYAGALAATGLTPLDVARASQKDRDELLAELPLVVRVKVNSSLIQRASAQAPPAVPDELLLRSQARRVIFEERAYEERRKTSIPSDTESGVSTESAIYATFVQNAAPQDLAWDYQPPPLDVERDLDCNFFTNPPYVDADGEPETDESVYVTWFLKEAQAMISKNGGDPRTLRDTSGSPFLPTKNRTSKNARKPDISLLQALDPLSPVHVRCVGEMKPLFHLVKRNAVERNLVDSDKGQALDYSRLVMFHQPLRQCADVFLTNTREIWFFRTERLVAGGQRSRQSKPYSLSPGSEGARYLCQLLLSGSESQGFFRPPSVLPDQLDSWIGLIAHSSASNVFRVKLRSHEEAVLKMVVSSSVAADREERALRALAAVESLRGRIPMLRGRVERCLLMSPVGDPFRLSLDSAVELLRVLWTIHNAKWYHGDVRPPNVLLFAGGAGFCDFGMAAPFGTAWAGTTANVFTSIRIIDAMMRGELDQQYLPQDDLLGLVACIIYFLTDARPAFASLPADLHALRDFWLPKMTGGYKPLFDAAFATNYAKLETELRGFLFSV